MAQLADGRDGNRAYSDRAADGQLLRTYTGLSDKLAATDSPATLERTQTSRAEALLRTAKGILTPLDAPAPPSDAPAALTARQQAFKLAKRRGSLLQMAGNAELGAKVKSRQKHSSALDFMSELVSTAAADERIRAEHSVKRNLDRPANMGYIEAPHDPVWSTSPFDVVGGWTDVERLHTEPGPEPGWARVPLDSEGIPVREWRTATRGAVVSLGSNLDKTTGIDALEMLYTPEKPQSPGELSASLLSQESFATDLRMASADALGLDGVMWSPELGLTTSEAVRLEARTFSPWRPLKVTLPEEPEPEPEPLVDSIYRMRRFRPKLTKSVQNNSIYVSVSGKNSADGSLHHPVQTVEKARELMKLQGATKTWRIPVDEDDPMYLLIDSTAVPMEPSSAIDESSRDPNAPESPCFLSKFPSPRQQLPKLGSETPDMLEYSGRLFLTSTTKSLTGVESLEDGIQSLNSTIKDVELNTLVEKLQLQLSAESVNTPSLVGWSPPRCVAAQLLDTRAVLSTPPAASVVPLARHEPSDLDIGEAFSTVPTPPTTPNRMNRSSPRTKSVAVSVEEPVIPEYHPEMGKNVDLHREAAVVAKINALSAAKDGHVAVLGLKLAAHAELRRDMDRYRQLIDSPSATPPPSRESRSVSIHPDAFDTPTRLSSSSDGAPNPAPDANMRLSMTKGFPSVAVVDPDGQLHTAPLQRHALELAMADELPQRMSADVGIVPPSAYAVLYWNGELIGQTQVVHSHRNPRWRHTFELAHIMTEEGEGHNSLEVEVWALPANSTSESPMGDSAFSPTPPGTPRDQSSDRPDSAGSSKLGGNKKLLGKAAWKGQPGEFPEGMHALALTAPKSPFFRSLPKAAHISTSMESVESGKSSESNAKPVTSGPRLTIKLIERPAVHTIRRETMTQHDFSAACFVDEMAAMTELVEAANEEVAQVKAIEDEKLLNTQLIEEAVEQVTTGGAVNAVVEIRHQAKRARWHANIKRAVDEATRQSIEWASMQLVMGLNKDSEEEANSAAAKLQVRERGRRGRDKAKAVKKETIEKELGLTGSPEEQAPIAKMQAAQRGKIARQELAEQK